MKDALLQSQLAIFESIDNSRKSLEMIDSRVKTKEIEKYIKRKDLDKLKQISKDWAVDVYKLSPIELRWKLEIEFLKVKCKTALPSDKWDHFDNYLQHIAMENGKELYGFENDSLQLRLINKAFNYPNWKKERKYIGLLIRRLAQEGVDKRDCHYADRYREFDLDYQFNKDCTSYLLINERNESWMKVIPDLVSNNNCFIAVGYFHLFYNCGLIEQLRAKGFIVEPIKLKPEGNSD